MIKVTRTCNKCGKTAEDTDFSQMADIFAFQLDGSYSSSYPADCSRVRFDLCGSCLKEFSNTFKIPIAEISL